MEKFKKTFLVKKKSMMDDNSLPVAVFADDLIKKYKKTKF